MKVLYRISLFFSVGCLTFFLGVITNQFYTARIENKLQQQNQTYETYEKRIEEQTTAASETTEKSVETTTQKAALVTCDTEYVVQAYQKDSQKTDEIIEQLPAKYIGMNRETLEEEIADYSLAPTLRDQEKGFESANMLSFSEEKVVVRKIYETPKPIGFYLAVDNNYVIVYESDLETVYTTTDILLQDLPKDLQDEIITMKYINSEEEVYQFLESHSS